MSWSKLASWWVEELATDPSYEEVVTPLLFEVFPIDSPGRYLDLGAGEGRVASAVRALGSMVVGLDLNEELLRRAGPQGVVSELPVIPFRDDSFDGALCVLTLEHVPDHAAFFEEAARVVSPRGTLAVVMNHPIWTAPGSTPITDSEGEVLWRPGDYFSDDETEIPAGESTVTFHHRSMAELLGSAAKSGWELQRVIERPHHQIEDQSGIPRLLACSWGLGP